MADKNQMNTWHVTLVIATFAIAILMLTPIITGNATFKINKMDINKIFSNFYSSSCVDADGDGYGAKVSKSCRIPYTMDCNDKDAAVNPSATDSCDKDMNCDGKITARCESAGHLDDKPLCDPNIPNLRDRAGQTWTKIFDGNRMDRNPGLDGVKSIDVPNSIYVYSSDEFYIGGQYYANTTPSGEVIKGKAWISRHNACSDIVWMQNLDSIFGGSPGDVAINDVVVPLYGEAPLFIERPVYAIGTGPNGGRQNIFLVKLNENSGDILWHRFISKPTNDAGLSISIDKRQENLYISGKINDEAYLAKYNLGTQRIVWEMRYKKPLSEGIISTSAVANDFVFTEAFDRPHESMIYLTGNLVENYAPSPGLPEGYSTTHLWARKVRAQTGETVWDYEDESSVYSSGEDISNSSEISVSDHLEIGLIYIFDRGAMVHIVGDYHLEGEKGNDIIVQRLNMTTGAPEPIISWRENPSFLHDGPHNTSDSGMGITGPRKIIPGSPRRISYYPFTITGFVSNRTRDIVVESRNMHQINDDYYDGLANREDQGMAIGSDYFGNSYVAGFTNVPHSGVAETNVDFFIRKYSVNGTTDTTRIRGMEGYE